MEKAKIKFLTKTAKLPTNGSTESAGYDLYGDNEKTIFIRPHCTEKIGTGLAITPPNGYFGAIVARSGLATKYGLAPANKIGICDRDYTGEYIVALHNDTDEIQSINSHERIAQLLFIPYTTVDWEETTELDDTERGNSGFGSSGKF